MATETKTMQTLANGTHITRTSKRILYRDGEGRTREELELKLPWAQAEDVRTVTVMDPVARTIVHWMTGEHQQTYALTTVPDMTARAAEQGSAPPIPVHTPDAAERARIMASNRKAGGDQQTEQLGAKTIAGVSCDAVRTTTTYAVDAFGNDRPFVVVNETCTSRELREVLEQVRDDPRSGVETTTVTSLTTTEPDPGLFLPPAGYTRIDTR